MRTLTLACAFAFAAAPAIAKDVSYSVGGQSYTGYFAEADDSKGVVVIVHDWDGLTDYEKQRAEMLADMGYDAFALDMFGDGTPTETVDHRRAATGALYKNRAKMGALIDAGLAQASAQSNEGDMVVMGYCFGGAVAMELARSERGSEVAGVATFHGGLTTPEGQSWDGDEAPILVLHGGADTSITMSDVAQLSTELEASGTPYQIEIYSGAPHAFTVFGSKRYREKADTESWSQFTSFLEERLGS